MYYFWEFSAAGGAGGAEEVGGAGGAASVYNEVAVLEQVAKMVLPQLATGEGANLNTGQSP